jgi:uncharacterized membrane protein YdbT with pleckstrin-like domain
VGLPARHLNPGEEVVLYVRPHWKSLARPVFVSVVALAGAIAALIYGVPGWAEEALGALLLVCLFWLGARYLRWATTSLALTTQRLVMRRGVLSRQTKEMLVDRLTDISCHQGLLDRLLRCGDVLIETPGKDSPEVFPNLPRPTSIQNEIYRVINERRSVGSQ